MEDVFGLSKCCHSPVRVVDEYESKFKALPNVHAYLLECIECKRQYVHYEEKEESRYVES